MSNFQSMKNLSALDNMSFNHPPSEKKKKKKRELLSKVMIEFTNCLFEITVFAGIYRSRVFIKFSKIKTILN